jgi:hypothetical protein
MRGAPSLAYAFNGISRNLSSNLRTARRASLVLFSALLSAARVGFATGRLACADDRFGRAGMLGSIVTLDGRGVVSGLAGCISS